MHEKPTSLEDDRLLTTAEFCRIAGGIQPQTARLWRMRGVGPRFVRIGNPPFGRVFYRTIDVRNWLAERSASSTTEETVREKVGR